MGTYVKTFPWSQVIHVSHQGGTITQGAALLYIAGPDCSYGVQDRTKSFVTIAFSSGILPDLHPSIALQVIFLTFRGSGLLSSSQTPFLSERNEPHSEFQ
jgi:hypothetical protein